MILNLYFTKLALILEPILGIYCASLDNLGCVRMRRLIQEIISIASNDKALINRLVS